MVFYTNAYDMSRKIAYLDYFKEQHGVYKGMKRVSVGGRKNSVVYYIAKILSFFV
jgi:phenylacetate-CoA ligase